LFIPVSPPNPPRVNYPTTPTVLAPYGLRFSRLQSLFATVKKGFEFADLTLRQIQGTKDPQFLELLNTNYRRQIEDLEKLWKIIHDEAEALKNGEFIGFPARDELSVEDKKEIGKATVIISIVNAPTLQMPLLQNWYGLWEEQLRL
jgi:hypothetical protein